MLLFFKEKIRGETSQFFFLSYIQICLSLAWPWSFNLTKVNLRHIVGGEENIIAVENNPDFGRNWVQLSLSLSLSGSNLISLFRSFYLLNIDLPWIISFSLSLFINENLILLRPGQPARYLYAFIIIIYIYIIWENFL